MYSEVMTAHDTQSFFKPDEFSCHESTILANCYNLAHVLLNRSQSDHLFVALRSLQYLAIIESNSFWFVDSMAYAVRGDEGGRLIRVSWHPTKTAHERESLTENMDCHVIFYGKDMKNVQTRLVTEFHKELLLLDKHQKEALKTDCTVSILPLRIN